MKVRLRLGPGTAQGSRIAQPPLENTMNPRCKKTLLTVAAIAALAAPGVAQARQGADDPAGHVRHSRGDDVRSSSKSTHRTRTRTRGGTHHASGHRRHGADDGPNHR
jgi:Ni/Co efflux regulator RcnB